MYKRLETSLCGRLKFAMYVQGILKFFSLRKKKLFTKLKRKLKEQRCVEKTIFFMIVDIILGICSVYDKLDREQ